MGRSTSGQVQNYRNTSAALNLFEVDKFIIKVKSYADGSTQGLDLFRSQNSPVPHQKPLSSTLKTSQFHTKRSQFNTHLSSTPKNPQFNTRRCVELRGFWCGTEECVELRGFRCETEEFRGLKRSGSFVLN